MPEVHFWCLLKQLTWWDFLCGLMICVVCFLVPFSIWCILHVYREWPTFILLDGRLSLLLLEINVFHNEAGDELCSS